jgi:parallel beta-helix repeat protein
VRGWSGGGVRGDAATGVAEKLRLAGNVGAIGLAMGNGSIIRDCESSGNGIGFFAPDRTIVSNCIATVNTGIGISGTDYVNVIDSTASRNGGVGIQLGGSNTVTRCSVTRNDGGGIAEGGGSQIADCAVGTNTGHGISLGAGSAVRNCTANANTQKGIVATERCQIIGNTCEANQTGIDVTGAGNRVDGNHCNAIAANTVGFHIGGSQNIVVRNTARGPIRQISPGVFVVDTAYVFDNSANNSYGPILGSASGQITSNSPWANFQNF